MQSEFKFQYQYSPNEPWKPFKHVLPENPSDAYKMYNTETVKNLKGIQKCPFPMIRQLLMVFTQDDYSNMDIDMPDLLRQKYYASPEDGETDREFNAFISRGEDAHERLDEIQGCLRHYSNLYNNVKSSLGPEYSSKIRQIQTQIRTTKDKIKQAENNLYSEIENGKIPSNSVNDRLNIKEEELKSLQKQRIIIYQQNKQKYQQTNSFLLRVANDYFTFLNYSEELQRALTTASAFQFKNNTNQSAAMEKQASKADTITEVQLKIKRIKHILKQKIQEAIEGLFEWRQKVKNSKPSQKDKETVQSLKNSLKEQLLKINNIIVLMNQLDSIFQNDRKNNRVAYNNANKMYRDFLPGYIEAKQVNQVYSRRDQYYMAIKQEKNRIKKHLQYDSNDFRDNFGLIVPYSQSEQYEKLVGPLKEKKDKENKKYLLLLFKKEMETLELAINFINQQYEKLYRMACGREPNARRKIEDWVKKFKKYEEDGQMMNHDENGCFVLLEESCRKLMWTLQ